MVVSKLINQIIVSVVVNFIVFYCLVFIANKLIIGQIIVRVIMNSIELFLPYQCPLLGEF